MSANNENGKGKGGGGDSTRLYRRAPYGQIEVTDRGFAMSFGRDNPLDALFRHPVWSHLSGDERAAIIAIDGADARQSKLLEMVKKYLKTKETFDEDEKAKIRNELIIARFGNHEGI